MCVDDSAGAKSERLSRHHAKVSHDLLQKDKEGKAPSGYAMPDP